MTGTEAPLGTPGGWGGGSGAGAARRPARSLQPRLNKVGTELMRPTLRCDAVLGRREQGGLDIRQMCVPQQRRLVRIEERTLHQVNRSQ